MIMKQEGYNVNSYCRVIYNKLKACHILHHAHLVNNAPRNDTKIFLAFRYKIINNMLMETKILQSKSHYITHKETAEAMKVTPATLSAWIKEGCPCVYFGKVTSSRRGSRPRFKIEEVEAWLKQRTKKGVAQ